MSAGHIKILNKQGFSYMAGDLLDRLITPPPNTYTPPYKLRFTRSCMMFDVLESFCLIKNFKFSDLSGAHGILKF